MFYVKIFKDELEKSDFLFGKGFLLFFYFRNYVIDDFIGNIDFCY